MSTSIYPFLDGAFAVGFLIAATFFLKYWSKTHSALLLIFSVAFTLLAVNYALVGLTDIDDKNSAVYLIRLAAFLLIILGILAANIRRHQ